MGLIGQHLPPRLIRPLADADRPLILAHLSALSADDRHARFARAISDSLLADYVAAIDLAADITVATFAGDQLLSGFLHLPVAGPVAELGMSVVPACRRQGLARLMFRYASMAAESVGVRRIHLAAAHPAALRIASGLGYRWQSHASGPRASIILPAWEFRLERLTCG